MRSKNPILNSSATARNTALNMPQFFEECDKGKYDSIALFHREGKFPESIKWHGGFGYDTEDKIKKLITSGDFYELIAYKNGTRKATFSLNSTAINAKFKVGDSVKVKGRGDDYKGVIAKEGSANSALGKRYFVEYNDGATDWIAEENLVKVNSTTAKNAAYDMEQNPMKVGDTVAVLEGYHGAVYGKVERIDGHKVFVKMDAGGTKEVSDAQVMVRNGMTDASKFGFQVRNGKFCK